MAAKRCEIGSRPVGRLGFESDCGRSRIATEGFAKMHAEQESSGPKLVGIVNVTEDSFSDGGKFLAPNRAIEHARYLYNAGAAVVELGPASSHPDAAKISAEQEVARLGPVVDVLWAENIPFGVDSFQTETQRWALSHGASMLNDIQGFADESFWAELALADCDLVVMHSIQERGPATREHFDASQIMDRVLHFFERRLAALVNAGIARERLIVDPGMGFFLGATPEPSLEVLRGLPRLRSEVGCRVLVSVSRKSFLGELAKSKASQSARPTDQRQAATLAAELYAVRHGADFIRTHDVQALGDAVRTACAIEGPGFFAGDGDVDP